MAISSNEEIANVVDMSEVISQLEEHTEDASSLVQFLAVIQEQMSAPADQPHNPASPLLATQLLPQLISLVKRWLPPSDGDCYDTRSVAVADAVSSCMCVLLQPAVDSYLHSLVAGLEANETAGAFSQWAPVLTILLGDNPAEKQQHDPAERQQYHPAEKQQYMAWLSEAAAALFNCNGETVHYGDSGFLEGDPDLSFLPTFPGSAAMLAIGCISLLQLALHRATTPSLLTLWPPHSPDSNSAARKFALFLAHDDMGLSLPSGAVSSVLFTLLLEGRGCVCKHLLETAGAVKALARPLERLARDPSTWQEAPYTYHVQVLAYLCQWTASVWGLVGIQELARELTQSAHGAVNALLQLTGDVQRKAACSLLRNCLVLLTHLASAGRTRHLVSRKDHVLKWLELAAQWQSQPVVLQHLALLTRSVVVDYACEPYFCPLFRQKGWCFDVANCSKATSGTGMPVTLTWDSEVYGHIAAIMDSTSDSITKALLVDLLARVNEGPFNACQPAGTAVLAAARYTAAAFGAHRSACRAGGDLYLYVATLGLAGVSSQQQALAVAMALVQRSREPGTFQWLQRHDRSLMASLASKHELVCTLLFWLGAFADGRDEAAKDPAARLMFLHNLEAAVMLQLVPRTTLIEHQVLERCLQLLPLLLSMEEYRPAVSIVHRVAVTCQGSGLDLPESSYVQHALPMSLTRPALLKSLLLYLSGKLPEHCSGAARWSIPAVPVLEFERESEFLGPQNFVRPLSLLLQAAVHWAKFTGTYLDELEAVLCCDPLWCNIERLVADGSANALAAIQLTPPILDLLTTIARKDTPKLLVSVAEQRLEMFQGARDRAKGWERSRLRPSDSDDDDELGGLLDDVLRPKDCDDTQASGSWLSKSAYAQLPDLSSKLSGDVARGSSGDLSAGGEDAAGPDARFCSACHKPAEKLQSCAKCGAARYCSKACQKSDWKLHKKQCRGAQRT